MNYLSLKEYAESRGLKSLESIRRQLVTYEDELRPHIKKTYPNNKILLDDYAVNLLDSHRAPKTEPIIEQGLEADREKIQQLQEQIIALQAENNNLLRNIAEIQAEQTRLIEYKYKAENLISQNENLRDQREQERARSEKLESDLQERNEKITEYVRQLAIAEAEANSYQKTIFGLYRKK